MTTSALDKQRIEDVVTDDHTLTVHLVDGRTLSVPLHFHPRLLNASKEQRNVWRLVSGGVGIHWPEIDEDLSLAGMLRGVRSPELRPEPSSVTVWAQETQDQYLQQAQDFFGQSMGRIKGRMQSDSAQLESIMQQLPQDAQARIQEMTDSYSRFEGIIDQAAQDAGVQDVTEQAAQQAKQSADEASGQGQSPADEVASRAQDMVGGVAGQAQDPVGGVTQQAQDAGQATDQVGQVAGQATDQAWQVAGEASSQD